MKNLKKLAIALNRLGLKKEAALVLSLKKIAFNPKAYNEIRRNIAKMTSIFRKISELLSDYLSYKRSDPEDLLLSDSDLRIFFDRIKDLIQGKEGEEGLSTLIDLSNSLAGDIQFMRPDQFERVTQFLSEIEKQTNLLYGLTYRNFYSEKKPKIQKAPLFSWVNKTEHLAKACEKFLEENKPDEIPWKSIISPYGFDPSREDTVIGLEKTIPGDIDSGNDEEELIVIDEEEP